MPSVATSRTPVYLGASLATAHVPVLTVCNHKGGTGKTTTSIHLAAALGRQGKRVLVVDLDPQGFLTRMLGAPEPPPEHSALGLLDGEADLRSFPVHSVSGFDLIGSSMALTRSLRRLTRPTDVLWLRETVRAGHDYDLLLLDTAAALSVYTMNALVASDHVVIPVTPEYQPVVGAEQTWQTAGLVQDKLNPRLAPPRFLLTQVDARLNRHARYAEYLRAKYGDAVLSTAIRTSSSLAVASRDGRTVFDSRHTTRGAVDYTAAAEEISGYVFGSGDGQVASAPSLSAPEAATPVPVETRSQAAAPAEPVAGATPVHAATEAADPTAIPAALFARPMLPSDEAAAHTPPSSSGEAPSSGGWTSLDQL